MKLRQRNVKCLRGCWAASEGANRVWCIVNCQCCRLGVARDAWRVCRTANGIRFAMICIILRLFRRRTVASQATRVYEHPEHLASSRIGRLTSSRCLIDASSGDMTAGRLEDDDSVKVVGTTEQLERLVAAPSYVPRARCRRSCSRQAVQ
jgi:hypothetical protein